MSNVADEGALPEKSFIFYIDVFSYCNLRCPSCLVGPRYGDLGGGPRGLVCPLSSNLNVLREPEALLAEHPDYLRVSVSGFTQEIYARGHREGDIERVKHNMGRLAAARDAVQSNTHIEVYYHRYADNAHELPLMQDFAASLGFPFATTLPFGR